MNWKTVPMVMERKRETRFTIPQTEAEVIVDTAAYLASRFAPRVGIWRKFMTSVACEVTALRLTQSRPRSVHSLFSAACQDLKLQGNIE